MIYYDASLILSEKTPSRQLCQLPPRNHFALSGIPTKVLYIRTYVRTYIHTNIYILHIHITYTYIQAKWDNFAHGFKGELRRSQRKGVETSVNTRV